MGGQGHKRTAAVRRAQRVLSMVLELHKRGYQRLRIFPGMSPSGCYWRCGITHVGNILRTHGALVLHFDQDTAHYSSASSNLYFNWRDARGDDARELADKFIDRFPDLVRKGEGQDWPYSGWYVQMLGLAEQGFFPVAYADFYSPPDPRYLPTSPSSDTHLPMPPPGEADGASQESSTCE